MKRDKAASGAGWILALLALVSLLAPWTSGGAVAEPPQRDDAALWMAVSMRSLSEVHRRNRAERARFRHPSNSKRRSMNVNLPAIEETDESLAHCESVQLSDIRRACEPFAHVWQPAGGPHLAPTLLVHVRRNVTAAGAASRRALGLDGPSGACLRALAGAFERGDLAAPLHGHVRLIADSGASALKENVEALAAFLEAAKTLHLEIHVAPGVSSAPNDASAAEVLLNVLERRSGRPALASLTAVTLGWHGWDMSGAAARQAAARALAQMLRASRRLQKLDVALHSLELAAVSDLLDGIQRAPALRRLVVRWVDIATGLGTAGDDRAAWTAQRLAHVLHRRAVSVASVDAVQIVFEPQNTRPVQDAEMFMHILCVEQIGEVSFSGMALGPEMAERLSQCISRRTNAPLRLALHPIGLDASFLDGLNVVADAFVPNTTLDDAAVGATVLKSLHLGLEAAYRLDSRSTAAALTRLVRKLIRVVFATSASLVSFALELDDNLARVVADAIDRGSDDDRGLVAAFEVFALHLAQAAHGDDDDEWWRFQDVVPYATQLRHVGLRGFPCTPPTVAAVSELIRAKPGVRELRLGLVMGGGWTPRGSGGVIPDVLADLFTVALDGRATVESLTVSALVGQRGLAPLRAPEGKPRDSEPYQLTNVDPVSVESLLDFSQWHGRKRLPELGCYPVAASVATAAVSLRELHSTLSTCAALNRALLVRCWLGGHFVYRRRRLNGVQIRAMQDRRFVAWAHDVPPPMLLLE